MNRKGGQFMNARRQSFPRGIKGKHKSVDSYKRKKDDEMAQEINQQPEAGLLDLPEEVILRQCYGKKTFHCKHVLLPFQD